MLPLIIEIVKHHAEGEITNLIKVWSLVFASLSYCFFLSKAVPGGVSRFLAIIPVLILNLILPLSLHTMHLGGSSAFFLVWLANFKLIMLAFGKGPLSEPSISLPKFAAVACLPIKSHQIADPAKRGLKSFWNYLAKALLICLCLKMYDYTDRIHPKLTWVLYSLHIYCGLEIILATFGGLAKALIGIELEPQFDEPYLSASLQWTNCSTARNQKPAVTFFPKFHRLSPSSPNSTGRQKSEAPPPVPQIPPPPASPICSRSSPPPLPPLAVIAPAPPNLQNQAQKSTAPNLQPKSLTKSATQIYNQISPNLPARPPFLPKSANFGRSIPGDRTPKGVSFSEAVVGESFDFWLRIFIVFIPAEIWF